MERYDCTGVWERVSRDTNTHASESRTSSPHPWTRIFLGSARNDECKHAATDNRDAATDNGKAATDISEAATDNGGAATDNRDAATDISEAATDISEAATDIRETVPEAILPVVLIDNFKRCDKFSSVWNSSDERPPRAGRNIQ